jgi:2-C-methyl-D-erythritol 2,4-cyclodiphosphate synthase
VGLGFDVHRFTKKRRDLVLGGIKIRYPQGLLAVSDGDVLLHAICDALLGAANLGDIGDYFAPSQPSLQGIDSRRIVKLVLERISKRFKIVNIDITLVADRPPLAKYKLKIIDSLVKIFKAREINLKIKSKERLNLLGSPNSISCLAIVLLEKCRS